MPSPCSTASTISWWTARSRSRPVAAGTERCERFGRMAVGATDAASRYGGGAAPGFGPRAEIELATSPRGRRAKPSADWGMLHGVKRLTPLDGSFLRVETSNAHMHVAWCGLFAPKATAPGPRSSRLPTASTRGWRSRRVRQRLAFPPPGLGEPYWVDDPRFHVRAHVTRLAPENQAVSHDRFMAMAGDALSEPLLRDRPLWHLYFLPRLETAGSGSCSRCTTPSSTGSRRSSWACSCSTPIPTRRP